jgi:hypothetical protein
MKSVSEGSRFDGWQSRHRAPRKTWIPQGSGFGRVYARLNGYSVSGSAAKGDQ